MSDKATNQIALAVASLTGTVVMLMFGHFRQEKRIKALENLFVERHTIVYSNGECVSVFGKTPRDIVIGTKAFEREMRVNGFNTNSGVVSNYVDDRIHP